MSESLASRRGRSIAVLTVLTGGAIALLATTQPWLSVALTDSDAVLDVPGSSAIPVMMPLSLAALALGAALSIVGRALRYVFAALLLLFAAVSLIAILPLLIGPPPVVSFAAVVTEHSGIAGESSVAQLVSRIERTAWTVVALVAQLLLVAAGCWALVTAHGWRLSGRRYATTTEAVSARGQKDAIDSWDELSRGDDPTSESHTSAESSDDSADR